MIKKLTLALAVAIAALYAHASPFKDPLALPAPMDARPDVDRMTAVTAVQGRSIAVGPDGRVLFSEDGARAWQQGSVPLSSDLVAVRLLNKELGWAVGHDGVILKTHDGGKNWTKQLDGFQAAKVMQAHYEKQASAGGSTVDATVLADAKRFLEEGPDKPFFDVIFLNDKEGFAVGAFNLSFRTTDGGRNWVPLYDRTANPQGLHLYGLAVANGVLYMVGEQGLVRRWNQGKESFEPVDSPGKGSFFGAIGRGSMLVVYGLSGNAFSSTNGGSSWTKLETRTTAGITSAAFLPDGRAVLATANGSLLVTDEAVGSVVALTPQRPMSYTGVTAAGPGGLVLTGNRGMRFETIKGSAKAQ